ncbi:hypothetical protein C8F04DRAFT_1255658 [Mycena alexandri]|uniref:SUN domain-containing protein n=1 Tax=Mycena alexandri TaxID=1745969 RepID=A0AAD6X8G0_9AGAR|nr:hypothetical protein C8F04DRAFT_1255658 [Mycena alexandri]
MLPTNAWRANAHLQPRRNPPRSTSFEYECEFERASFRRLATPPTHYRQTPSTTASPALSEVSDASDSDDSSTATRKQRIVGKSHLSKNLLVKVIVSALAFFCTITNAILRLFLYSLWSFLKLVDGLALQHLRTIALHLASPLFIVMFVILVSLVILGIPSPVNVPHTLRLPESPPTSIQSAQHSDGALSLDSTRHLDNTLSGLSLHSERTRGEIRALEAQAKHQSLQLKSVGRDLEALQLLIRTHAAEIPSHATASSELNDLRRDLHALQLLVRRNAAEIASHTAASSQLHGFRRDLDALQLLVRRNGAEIASHTAASSQIDGLRRDVEAVRLIVEAFQLQQYVAQPDFALHSTGASVIPSLTSQTYTIALRPSTFAGKVFGYFTNINVLPGRPPITALHHDIHDGHCWPFAGSHGQLGIVLGNLVYIEAITIDHVAAAASVNTRTSAPKDMEVWAMVEGQDNVAKLAAWRAEVPLPTPEYARPKMLPKLQELIRIASFQYDVHAPKNIQTFPIDPEIRNLGIDFGVIVLVVTSNWGMGEYTCLYRIRVHGGRAVGPATPDS